ncbi:High frequency lysogenization protein HflD [Serratia fonticola]|uniref:High frequency lysogenization protein HflD n=1 Tax=Serratia fonticola TaxID=47917 RepID=A0A4U9V4T2_SERFO|nr:High frequency lysogenization protein HflD [Serratia fonticola]
MSMSWHHWGAYSGNRFARHLAKSAGAGQGRATLLAGIRAAVLWQQVGGSRLQLMFSRNRLLKQAQNIVAHC